MAHQFKIEIPIEKCCAKYLQAYHGDSITVSIEHPIGAIVHGLLQQPEYIYNDKVELNKNLVLFPFIVPIELSKSNIFHISKTKIRVLNKILKEWVQYDLLRMVIMASYFGVQQKIAISEFRLMYEIEEEDWSTDAIVKYIQRNKNNFSDKSPLKDFCDTIKKNQGVQAVLN